MECNSIHAVVGERVKRNDERCGYRCEEIDLPDQLTRM